MSYAPATFHAGTGEDFFRKEGFLVDGMVPLVTGRYTWPTFDAQLSGGAAITITNSVAAMASNNVNTQGGYNLGATYTKLLAMTYCVPCTADWGAVIAFNEGTFDASADGDDKYECVNYGGVSKSVIYKKTTTYTEIGTETTIYQDDVVTSPVIGTALYVSGNGGSDADIKMFYKGGTSQWIPILSVTDGVYSTFQSVHFGAKGSSARWICPMMVWGS